MASRMERYYKTEERSKKNEHLYQQISELGSYTNIESVADISNSNEIDIDMVKKMITSREELQKTRNYENLLKIKEEEKPVIEEEQEEKNYDIRDILNKAKIDHSDSDSKYRNLKNSQYEILRNIKINPQDEDVKNILESMTLHTSNSADLGIFDSLKSDTMVGDAASIKKILDEVKKNDDEPKVETVTSSNLANIDNTFYTSSFSFSDKDFEDLKNLDNNLQKNNKLIKIMIIIFSVLIAIVILYVLTRVIF